MVFVNRTILRGVFFSLGFTKTDATVSLFAVDTEKPVYTYVLKR